MRRKKVPAYTKALDQIFIVEDVPRVRFDFYATTTAHGLMDTKIRLTRLNHNTLDLVADSAQANPDAFGEARLKDKRHTVMVVTAEEWLQDSQLRRSIETIDALIAGQGRPSGPA